MAKWLFKSEPSTWSWKDQHGNLGNKVKTTFVSNLAPQAKPPCSRDLYRNSEQNPGVKIQRSFV